VPDLMRAMVERYQFNVLPQNLGEAIRQGVKFEHGKWTHEGQPFVVKELAMYADGVKLFVRPLSIEPPGSFPPPALCECHCGRAPRCIAKRRQESPW
jgi:hypothetical protein